MSVTLNPVNNIILLIILCILPTIHTSAPGNWIKDGCTNFDLVSVSNTIEYVGHTTPCWNCTQTNDTKIKTLATFKAEQGVINCLCYDNITSYTGDDHVTIDYPSCLRARLLDVVETYPIDSIYKMAVNIKPKFDCFCSCPYSPSRFKCYKGFNYCKNQTCQNYFLSGIYSDCIGNIFKDDSHACCSMDFSEYETALYLRVRPKISITSQLRMWYAVFNGTWTIDQYFCGADFEKNYSFYPNTGQQLLNCSFTNVLFHPQWTRNVIANTVGQFANEGFDGDIEILHYNNEFYVLDSVNKLDEYNPSKYGWLKFHNTTTAQKAMFDTQLLKEKLDLKVDSCEHDRFKTISDVNLNDVSKLKLLSEYLDEYDLVLNSTMQEMLDTGVIEILSNKASTLFTLETYGNFYTIGYTYSVTRFNCTAHSETTVTELTCVIESSIGSTYVHVSVHSVNSIINTFSRPLGGTGLDTITFTIPSPLLTNQEYICMNGVNSELKCSNITIEGFQTVVGNASWNRVIYGKGEDSSGDSINFNFWDWTSWASNILYTILCFLAIFIIFIVIVSLIVLFIFFMPQINNLKNRFLLNRNYSRLNHEL